VVDDLLPTLRSLRVLSLSHYKNFTVLPDSIYNLLHLRYLDLSYTEIKSLPDSTCELYYLQTLNLYCTALTELPTNIGKLINLRHLNLSRTNISKMPMQIVELKNLQTLTFFVVGKHGIGLSVSELGKFPNLRGKLCIQNLHNVIDVNEACDANLKSKHLEKLELYWDKNFEDSPIDKVVLDALQPSINLKKLTIGSYGGTSFPSWLGDSSFSNMVYLCIGFCDYCVALPPLGQLPSLKDLSIQGMSILETIGPEFYGMLGGGSNSPLQPFPSLEHLEFSFMSNWKEWLPFGGSKFPFPRLKTLKLEDCQELRGHLPCHLSSIEEITIIGCDHLLATPPTMHSLSSVKSLDVRSSVSTEWALFESDSACLLQRVKIWNFQMMMSLLKMFMSTTCLQHLELYYIPSLTTFPDDGLPTSLQSLHINECKNLAFLPPETWSKYTSLVTLELWTSCDALTSFPLNGFPVLQRLSILGCGNLQCLFISEISSHFPSTLQSLEVSDCDALRSLPQQMDTLTALESLSLKLQLLPFYEGSRLPPKLRLIYIENNTTCDWMGS
jgi:Leucine-rich repeat (LRR) protein